MVDVHSATTVGAEALVRWNHPTAGLIAPGDFIGNAEDSGIMIPLGAHVLETACRQLALWRESTLRDVDAFKLAVNISAMQLSTPDLFDQLRRLLEETGIPPAWIYLEITETAAIADLDHVARKVEEIRALGVRIAIDDRIGHNSLQHLSGLPVDVVKIDQSFVAALDWQPSWTGMAAAVIALARTLGMRTVAEGVETPAQPHGCASSARTWPRGTSTGRRSPRRRSPRTSSASAATSRTSPRHASCRTTPRSASEPTAAGTLRARAAPPTSAPRSAPHPCAGCRR